VYIYNCEKVYSSVTCRSRRQLDGDAFRSSLLSALLCNADNWPKRKLDDLARQNDTETIAVLDKLVLARTVSCRSRPSDPRFDEEWRAVKRRVRQLERAARRADPSSAATATVASYNSRREYTTLFVVRSVSRPGSTKSTPNGHHQVSCGTPSMFLWALVESRCVIPSVLTGCISSSM
jgi:hypothetical protein